MSDTRLILGLPSNPPGSKCRRPVSSTSKDQATRSSLRPAIRVGIVEDQKLVLSLLRQLCEREFGFEVAFLAETGREASDRAPEAKADLVLLDINLPDEDGIVTGMRLKSQVPGLRVIMISAECTEYTVHRMRASGLDGYIDKNSDPTIIKRAVTEVLDGRRFFSEVIGQVRRQMIEDANAFSKVLSEAEQAMLPLFGMGYSDDDIAGIMSLSAETIRWHRKRIMGKLNVRTATELVHYCLEKGFIQTRPGGDTRPAGAPRPG